MKMVSLTRWSSAVGMTDVDITLGHPGTPVGLMHIRHSCRRTKGLLVGDELQRNLFSLTAEKESGGRPYLDRPGDYPERELGQPTNAELIAKVAEQARALGREVATVDDTAKMLAMTEGAAAA